MEPKYGQVFASVFEAVGDLTLAQESMKDGHLINLEIRIRHALDHLQDIAKDFPFEYQEIVYLKQSLQRSMRRKET